MPKPNSGTYHPSFQVYIDKVEETDIHDAFRKQQQIVDTFFHSIPEDKYDYAYASGKWTLKEMLQHIIDSERIFNYRALCFARKESESLPGFEENMYADNSNASARSWDSLVSEFKTVRKSSVFLFESFTDEMLNFHGLANNHTATALSIGYAIVGHLYHHVYIIETKYLGGGESC